MSQSDDVKMMQTAASLANLAALVYDKLLVLPAAVADPRFARAKSFLGRAKAQNVDEAGRFNAAALRLGGEAQDKPDPILEPAIMRSMGYAVDLWSTRRRIISRDVIGCHLRRVLQHTGRNVGGGRDFKHAIKAPT